MFEVACAEFLTRKNKNQAIVEGETVSNISLREHFRYVKEIK